MTLRAGVLVGIVGAMASGMVGGALAFRHFGGFDGADADERMLLAAVREIGASYVEPVSRRELVDNAIRGLVAGLDEHSAFLDEHALIDMHENAVGTFGGVGMELGLVDGYITVARPMEDAPAARAGIVAGDRIIAVDHRSLKGRTLSDAVRALRGKPGTAVQLRVRRGNGETRDVELIRDTISMASVRSRLLAPGVGYVRVSYFSETTPRELAQSLAAIEHPAPLDALILDMRGNPGGLLTAAVAVADAFLDGGVIVRTEGRAPAARRSYEADDAVRAGSAALAVLIDSGSASGAEVVAAALQDHGRATVLGTRSFGKASVQSVMHFQGRAIKLTTARYLTPSGRSIQDGGVAPDISLPPARGEDRASYEERLIEAAREALRGVAAAPGAHPA